MNFRKQLTVVAVTVACLCGAGQFKVVTNGQPNCRVVISRNADHVVALAAEELKKWIGEITGATIEIAHEAASPMIELAVTNDIHELKDNDGYAIRVGNGVFRIIGSCPKGVLNGVYKVLYRNTDIIWARPDTAIGTVFSHAGDIIFSEDDMVDVPVYKQRGWQMTCRVSEAEANSVWQTRNCSNWMVGEKYVNKYGCIKEFGEGHNIASMYLPEKLYYKDHADFYPLVDGERIRYSEYRNGCQLCFTNPEMTKEFIRRLDEFVQKNMDRMVFRVMLEDNYMLCTCPTCMAPIKLPDGTVLDGRNLAVESREWKVWRSTQFFLWFNQLADFMAKKYPGKRLLSFAYFFTEYAPKIAIPENVDISFCPIYRDSKHTVDSPQNKIVLDTLNEWLDKTKNVTWREYYGINSEYPRAIDRIAFHDYAFLSKHGMTKTYSEMVADTTIFRWELMVGTKCWDMGAPFMWSLAQAPWNPNRNVEDVRREYYRRVFGSAAAPEVEAMYAEFEKGWHLYRAKSYWNDRKSVVWRNCYGKSGIAPAVRTHLANALKLVNNPKGKEMLLRIQGYLDALHATPSGAPIVIPKAKEAVPFAASATSPAWENALTMTDLVDEKGAKGKHPTMMKFIHDGVNIYAYMHAVRPGIGKMLDHRKDYCQTEAFNVQVQLTDETFPDYFHVMADPINRVYASASNNREVPEFTYKFISTHAEDWWDCLIVIPIAHLPKTHRIAAFRRLFDHNRPGCWPQKGPGFKGTVIHEVDTFSPFTLGE